MTARSASRGNLQPPAAPEVRPTPRVARRAAVLPVLVASTALPLLLLACAQPAAAPPAGCDLTAFERPIADTTGTACARGIGACPPAHLPFEVQAIERGAAHETLGLGANDGRATWLALDLTRRQLVKVERYAGSRLAAAPAVQGSEFEQLRATGSGPRAWVDHVRRWPLAPAEATALACRLAPAWSAAAALAPRSGTGQRLYLFNPAQVKTEGGPGVLQGPGAGFAEAAEAIASARSPGAAPR